MARVLTPGERRLAEDVFGDAVRLDEVRLHRGGFGAFAVTLGSHLFLPPHLTSDDYALADPLAQALLVHELTHIWQFQTRPLATLASWARVMMSGGYGPGLPGYRYALPLAAFEDLNLEQQASVVEHAFLLRAGHRSRRMPEGISAVDLTASPFPSTRAGAGPWGSLQRQDHIDPLIRQMPVPRLTACGQGPERPPMQTLAPCDLGAGVRRNERTGWVRRGRPVT